jgi:hypothetical protein
MLNPISTIIFAYILLPPPKDDLYHHTFMSHHKQFSQTDDTLSITDSARFTFSYCHRYFPLVMESQFPPDPIFKY